jgi:hypothetical protein
MGINGWSGRRGGRWGEVGEFPPRVSWVSLGDLLEAGDPLGFSWGSPGVSWGLLGSLRVPLASAGSPQGSPAGSPGVPLGSPGDQIQN